MFRAAAGNVFDVAVAKATDENLTSENWEYILVGDYKPSAVSPATNIVATGCLRQGCFQ